MYLLSPFRARVKEATSLWLPFICLHDPQQQFRCSAVDQVAPAVVVTLPPSAVLAAPAPFSAFVAAAAAAALLVSAPAVP